MQPRGNRPVLHTFSLLLATLLIGSIAPVTASASDDTVVLLQKQQIDAKSEQVVKEDAKELLFQAPEATPLTVEGEEALKEHYVEKYMPVEGCSLVDELPVTSDINYVPPKPKPKPVKKVVKKTVEPKTEKAVEKKVEEETPVPKEAEAIEKEVEVKVETKVEESVESDEVVSSAIAMTDDERYWLEKLVEAESANESFEGKVAVASVIANRVELPEFPNTVMKVIRQPKQFSPFMDGSIERRTASADTKRAVAQVFDEGKRNIPSNVGFFCTTAIAPHSWIGQTKAHYKTIGNHAFYLK